VHLISPNVYQTWPEALETFEWFSKTGEWDRHFPRWERNMMVYVGAAAMWAISKRLKKRHELSDDVRWHLYKACNRWTDEVTKKKKSFSWWKTARFGRRFGVWSTQQYGRLPSVQRLLAQHRNRTVVQCNEGTHYRSKGFNRCVN